MNKKKIITIALVLVGVGGVYFIQSESTRRERVLCKVESQYFRQLDRLVGLARTLENQDYFRRSTREFDEDKALFSDVSILSATLRGDGGGGLYGLLVGGAKENHMSNSFWFVVEPKVGSPQVSIGTSTTNKGVKHKVVRYERVIPIRNGKKIVTIEILVKWDEL